MAAQRINRRRFLHGSGVVAGLGLGALIEAGLGAGSGRLFTGASSSALAAPGYLSGSAPMIQRRQSGKTITMGMWQPVPTLNTLMTSETGNVVSSSRLVLRGLLFVDEQANPIGELATETPTPQNGGVSADGKTITFKLRQGVTWHDGKPVTAADVKFTWELIMKPTSGVVSRYGYEVIDAIDTPDDLTAIMRYKEPFAAWQTLFDVIVPKHVLGDVDNLIGNPFNQRPIGFGPFKAVENVTGDHMTFEAFDGYWRGRPKIDRLYIRYFGDANAMMQSLRAKESELSWQVPLSAIPELRRQEAQGITGIVTPQPNPEQYAFNRDENQVPLFADRDLRRALSLAVDRQTIVDRLLFGLATLAINPWDQSPWQNRNLKPIEYNPEESKRILDGLGWQPGSDGIRVKNGQRLSFNHTTTSGNQLRENQQLLIQQNFQDIGVEMIIKNARSDTMFGSWAAGGVLARGDYELAGFSYPLTSTDPDISNRFLCRERPSESSPTGAQRYRYCNPQIDMLFAEQAREADPTKRRAIVDQIQQILYDEHSQIFLYDSAHSWGIQTRVKNFKLTPFAGFQFNPHEWDLE